MKAAIPILILKKTFKTETITRDKHEHIIITKGPIHWTI